MWEKYRFIIMVALTIVTFVGFTLPNILLFVTEPEVQLLPPVTEPPKIDETPGSTTRSRPDVNPIPTKQKWHQPPPIQNKFAPPKKAEKPKPKRLDEEDWYLKLKAVTSLAADVISSLFPVMTAFFSVKIWFRQRRERRLPSGSAI
jgi:hypothetical protein